MSDLFPKIIKFIKLHPNAKVPEKATKYAAGYDVFCTEITWDNEMYCFRCKTGLAVEIPEGYKLVIVPRSSITKSGWFIPNSPAQIDSDYRGEIELRFRSIPSIYFDQGVKVKVLDEHEFPYKRGDRIAQCFLEEIINVSWKEVEELSKTDRDSGGFGSTGK